MYRRNPGKFCREITLLAPSAPVRDELGGLAATTYTSVLSLRALMSDKNQTRRQVLGNYVTSETKYFVTRDLRDVASVATLDTSWRLVYNGVTYLINQIDVIDESRPYYMQFTATAINAGGAAR